jgi:hypothetical protein
MFSYTLRGQPKTEEKIVYHRMTWNDCVLNDLEDFGISTKTELLTNDGWLRVKELTLDRDEWRRRLQTDGSSGIIS